MNDNSVNPENYKELIIGDAAVANAARYDISLPTVIFIHGFLMNGHSDEQILKMRDGKPIHCYHEYNTLLNTSYIFYASIIIMSVILN